MWNGPPRRPDRWARLAHIRVGLRGLARTWPPFPAAPDLTDEMVADVHGGGPAVVLLHGQPGSSADWQRVTPLLQSRFSVVVPDRPGYGRTGGRATGFVGNARALAGLLDRLGVEQAIVVGHSWGGGVAIAAAEMYPQRFTGLILAASVAPSERLGWNDRILAAPVIGDLIAGLTIGLGGRMLGSSPIQLLAERRLAGRSQDAIKAVAKMTGARAGTRVWQSFVSEQRALIDELDDLAPALGSLRIPTAILNGGLDRIVPASVGARLARSIPDAVHTVLPHSGHLLPHDHPDSIAAAVAEVWNRGRRRPEDDPAGSAPSDGYQSDGYQTDK